MSGTEPSARIRLTEKLLQWADIVFVMEKKHKQRIQQKFTDLVNEKETVVRNIPDEYQFMDEELVSSLKMAVLPYL
ncbi:protein tyrosine phosphatase [Emticicia sp. BO119]|uniref:protein tyrosine phosphatase n=1 Tax=Emticicia sp. BO119 TaxID=2757768 RepID=UPI001E44BBC9|nr:protein tyrosine phosphatase [Emticicia sp. BO119]